MNLSIDQFNPFIANLSALADSVKNMPKITDINDTILIEKKKAKGKELVRGRRAVKELGKLMRDETNAFNKTVLKREKEVLGIIIPLEDEIKIELAEIEKLQKLEERRAFLPTRKVEMHDLQVEITEEELLEMDSAQYNEFKNEKLQEKLQREQEKLEEEKRKLNAEKQKLEDAKQNEKERQDEEKRAKIEAKEAEEKRVALERKHEKEKLEIAKQAKKDAIIKEREDVKRKENARIEKEQREKNKKEKEAEIARKNSKFFKWKKSLNDDTLEIIQTGNQFVAYKKISEITIL